MDRRSPCDAQLRLRLHADLVAGREPDRLRAVSQCEGGHPQDIWVVNADGSGERRVTRQKQIAQNPDWSPDGTKIVFERTYGIYSVNVDGSGLRRLTASCCGPHWESEPAWSPDGLRIAYVGSGGASSPMGIWIMNADGSGKHRVTASRGGDTSPAWSADGRKIVFTCSAHPVSDICVVNANGSGRRRLTEDDAENRDPDWQPIAG